MSKEYGFKICDPVSSDPDSLAEAPISENSSETSVKWDALLAGLLFLLSLPNGLSVYFSVFGAASMQ